MVQLFIVNTVNPVTHKKESTGTLAKSPSQASKAVIDFKQRENFSLTLRGYKFTIDSIEVSPVGVD